MEFLTSTPDDSDVNGFEKTLQGFQDFKNPSLYVNLPPF